MLFKMTELKYRPDPVLERALDMLFIMHADHEQNCSTTTARIVGSAHAAATAPVQGVAAAVARPLPWWRRSGAVGVPESTTESTPGSTEIFSTLKIKRYTLTFNFSVT